MEQKNLDIYGSAPLPWARALGLLEANRGTGTGSSYFLTTARPDGRPHVAAFGALWVDGTFYFTSGPKTRKSRDIAKNPAVVLSAALSGLDPVGEGTGARVTDGPTLERLAKLYAAQGWHARVSDGAITAEYSAPSAGRPPWYLYAMTPSTAFAVATAEPWGATRWRF